MSADTGGVYRAVVPGQRKGDIVQFYVQAQDGLGAVSMFPAAGRDSRALFQVDDGLAARSPHESIDTFRIIMSASDRTAFYASTEKMSNEYIPVTLVVGDSQALPPRVGAAGRQPLDPPQQRLPGPSRPRHPVLWRPRLDPLRLQRARRNRHEADAEPSRRLAVEPVRRHQLPDCAQSSHTGVALLQLAQYDNVFLDEQFENGSEGTKFEVDDVTYPIAPQGGPEGLKADTGVNQSADIGVSRRGFEDQWDNKEFFRSHVLIKNQRTKDDYESVMQLAKAIHLTPDEGLAEAVQEVMDVDLWMRHYANQSYFGNWDTYGFGRPKNLRIYVRPEDGKFLPLYWDCDLCNFTETIYKPSETTSRLDEDPDIPANLRLYWGHMLDLINRSFNEAYVTPWAQHYGELTGNQNRGGDESFTTIISSGARTTQALREMTDPRRGGIPKVPFEITTNGGADFQVDGQVATLAGTGWIDVCEVRLAGSDQPLDVTWTDEDSWELVLPVGWASIRSASKPSITRANRSPPTALP